MSLKFGLEAGYHFTGDATDFSGNSNDLSVGTGTPALTTDKNSVSNQAYDYDGSSAHRDSDYSMTTVKCSASIWIKMDVNNKFIALNVNRSGGNSGINISHNDNTAGKFRAYVYDGTTIVATETNSSSYTSTTEWYHVVFTYDGSNFKLYVNGIEDGTATGTITSTTFSDLQIGGAFKGSWSNHLNGKVDESRIYNRVLTQYEILQLYYGYDTTFNQYGILRSGLDAEYQFTGNTNDTSGNGNNATNNGATLTTDKNSVSNQAYDYDGTNDYMDTGFTPNSTRFSVSMWVKTDDANNRGFISTLTNTGTDRKGFNIAYLSGEFVANVYNSGGVVTLNSGIATDNTSWYHLVLTYDSGTCKFYTNGILKETNTSTITSFHGNMHLGAYYITTLTSLMADGKIDEVKIYDREITDTEVLMLYYGYDITATSFETLDQDIQGLYHFTGDLTDSSGNSNTLTNNGAILTTDKNAVSNQAYDFDGTNDRMTSSTVWVTGYPFTMTAHVAQDLDVTNSAIVSVGDVSANNVYYYLGSNNGTPTATVRNTTINEASGTTDMGVSGTWYGLAATFESSSKREIFVNGVSEGTNTTSVTFNAAAVDTSAVGYPGDNGAGVDQHFGGKIDEVRVYSRLCTEDEIIELTYGYDTPTMAEDGAGGYSNKVFGVTPGKIMGVDVANISKFNGV